MVHISEVAPTFVKEITDYITVGETVKVRVLNIGEDVKNQPFNQTCGR